MLNNTHLPTRSAVLKVFFNSAKDDKKIPRRLPDKISEKIQKLVFVEITDFEEVGQIRKIKKIKGYDTFYRIRVGEYRIGYMGKDNEIVFYRALHRKDIYRYSPWRTSPSFVSGPSMRPTLRIGDGLTVPLLPFQVSSSISPSVHQRLIEALSNRELAVMESLAWENFIFNDIEKIVGQDHLYNTAFGRKAPRRRRKNS